MNTKRKSFFGILGITVILTGIMLCSPVLAEDHQPTKNLVATQNPKHEDSDSERHLESSSSLVNPTSQVLKSDDRCTRATNSTKDLQTRFEKNKTDSADRYKKTVESLNQIVSRFKEKGLNTSTLENEIVVLNNKIEKYNQDLKVLIQDVQNIPVEVCKVKLSETPKPSPTVKPSQTVKPSPTIRPSFSVKPSIVLPTKIEVQEKKTLGVSDNPVLAKLREDLSVVKSDIADISNYFSTVIKPTIKDLKSQLISNITLTPKPTETEKP